jgi:Fe-S cluster assembly iron-binding protein IscA
MLGVVVDLNIQWMWLRKWIQRTCKTPFFLSLFLCLFPCLFSLSPSFYASFSHPFSPILSLFLPHRHLLAATYSPPLSFSYHLNLCTKFLLFQSFLFLFSNHSLHPLSLLAHSTHSLTLSLTLSLSQSLHPPHLINSVYERNGAQVVVDNVSINFIKGSRIDWTTELVGSQFKILDNPQSSKSCGCGASFNLKEG